MIGLFFRYHDDGFVLNDGPIRDDPSQSLESHPFRAGRVQPMSCVPRSYFLGKAQDFESIPGYTMHLKITSRHARRKPSEWQSMVEVNSQQTTPLNLAAAESIFFEASHSLEGILRTERESFEERHRNCTQPSRNTVGDEKSEDLHANTSSSKCPCSVASRSCLNTPST